MLQYIPYIMYTSFLPTVWSLLKASETNFSTAWSKCCSSAGALTSIGCFHIFHAFFGFCARRHPAATAFSYNSTFCPCSWLRLRIPREWSKMERLALALLSTALAGPVPLVLVFESQLGWAVMNRGDRGGIFLTFLVTSLQLEV